ncbi:hypothetical protein PRK78_000305 [Emydomyces testavorans]|uniref:Uncharacterized protein n=1 Tax=Emydomyces testavorans TaxID=2070801 RepID=A0AAF0DAG4_9EURO|nr:hypothetical protein PRK78_000305 [Emydomyces testavorans]
MEANNLATHKRNRLEQLAANAGVFMNKQLPLLRKKDSFSSIAQGDKEEAEALVKRKRLESFSSKSHIFRRTPSRRNFRKHELYAAIETVIRENMSVGILECLLVQVKDAKAERKLFRYQQDNDIDITTLLRLATEKRQSGMVYLLASHADLPALTVSLQLSVVAVDLDCVKALLQNGADPNFCQSAFLENVRNGNLPFVKLLLSSEKRLVASCLDEALPIAVSTGLLELVIILLQQGANAESGTLFEMVVRSGRKEFTAAFVLARRPPSLASLDRALGIVLHEPTALTEDQRFIIDILLCAGASGENVTKALMRAVATDDQKLARMVVSYHHTVFYNPSEAITEAVRTKKFQLLNIIFDGKLDSECASAVLANLPNVSSGLRSSEKLWIVSTLVKHGASGVALHEYLVDSVQQSDVLLVNFLVDHGASVDYNDAKPLCLAVSLGSLQIFKKLLDGKPSQDSYSRCFRLLTILPANLQLEFVSKLLVAGARGEEVNKILARVFSDSMTFERNQFIELLVRHGADVNVMNGYCFQEVIKLGDITALSLLLKGKPSALSLSRAVLPATQLSDKELRLMIVDLLLSAGAHGPLVDQQLIGLMEEKPLDLVLIGVFLEKGNANVNSEGGKPLQLACRRPNLRLLNVLLQYQPSAESINAAFETAMSLKDPTARYKVCRRLLDVGVNEKTLDASLISEQQSPSSNAKLMELLLNYGADVNSNDGILIRRAVEKSDEQQLALFASRRPSQQTVVRGLELLLLPNIAKRHKMARILLNVTDSCISETLSFMLPEAVGINVQGIRFLRVLLKHGASVDYQQGLAIRKAIDNDYFDAFKLFLRHPVAPSTLEAAFQCCLAAEASRRIQYTAQILEAGYRGRRVDEGLLESVQESPCNQEMVILLLKHGASADFANSQCLVHLAISQDDSTLRLLLESLSDKAAVTDVFGKTISAGMGWLSASGLPTIKLLLQHGASGEGLNLALIAAIENTGTNPEAAQFVDLFLQFGASVNYHDGRALRAAIVKGQPSLVKRIVDANPSNMTLMIGFGSVFNSDLSEDMSLELVEILLQSALKSQTIDDLWRSDRLLQESPLFSCLKKWPCGTKVLKKLLQSGMDANETIPWTIDSEDSVEQVSLLLWALQQPKQRVSPCVIECLLVHRADPNFQSKGSWKTPVLVAAMESTPDIVLNLIKYGADVTACDKTERTPLFYASRRNQIDTMHHLIEAGATVDDGSLHEAAQSLNLDAIQLLLSHGHDPNFPSLLHDGRCALANLCLYAPSIGLTVSKTRQAIDALIAGKADLRAQNQGKSLLFHAMNNSESCIRTTTALLASGMWKLINDNCNLFTSDSYVYSPSTYISKNLQTSPREHGPQLLHILKAHGCKDVFYRLSGPQPPDMINAPPEITAEENRRQARNRRLQEQEEDHQIQLTQNMNIASQQNMLITQAHILQIQHDRELADEREINTERFAKQQVRLHADSAIEQTRLAQHSRMLALEHMETLAQLRLQTVDCHGRLQIEQERQSAQIERELLNRKLAVEMQRVKEIEAANERQYKRDVEVLTRQEKIFAERKQMLSDDGAILDGNEGAHTPTNKQTQLQLTYPGTELD